MAAREYDVLIIGTGASGGMAAYTLTRLGVSCLMLETGPLPDFERNRTLRPVYDLPYRRLGKPGRLPQPPDDVFVECETCHPKPSG